MNEFSEDFPTISVGDAKKTVSVVHLKMPQKRKSRRQVNCDTKKSAKKVLIEECVHNRQKYALTRNLSPPASVPEGDVFDFTDMTPEREIEPPPRLFDQELWDPSDEGHLLRADRPELTKKSYWGGRYLPKPFVARSGEAKEDNTFYFSGFGRKREHREVNNEIPADSTFSKLPSVIIPIRPMETISKMPRILYPVVPNIRKLQLPLSSKTKASTEAVVNKSATESFTKFKIPKLSTATPAKSGQLKSPVQPPTSGKLTVPDDLGRKRLPSEDIPRAVVRTKSPFVAETEDNLTKVRAADDTVAVTHIKKPNVTDKAVNVPNDTGAGAVDADEQSPESWSPTHSNDHPPSSPTEGERDHEDGNSDNNQDEGGHSGEGGDEDESNNSPAVATTSTTTTTARPLILLAPPSASIEELVASIPETSHVIVGVTRNLATFSDEYPPEIMRKAALYHSTRPIHSFVDLWSRVGRVFEGLRAMGRNVSLNTESINFVHPQDYTVYALVATR